MAEHGVGELFSSIWTLFMKRHLQGKLKFDAIESQDLFCQFLAYTLAHTFEKFSGVCRQRVLGRHVHLPGSQVISYCPGRSVEDLSLFLLFFEHLHNLLLVVLDHSDYLLRRLGSNCPKMALLSRSFHAGGGRTGRYFLGNRGLSKRLFTVSGIGSSRIFLTTFWAGSDI